MGIPERARRHSHAQPKGSSGISPRISLQSRSRRDFALANVWLC
jgi:hypothetical protein